MVPFIFTCKADRVRPGTRTKLYRTALCTDIDTNCPGKRAEKNFSRYMAPTIPGQFFSAFSHNYKKTFISAYYSDKKQWQIICNKKNKFPVKRLVFSSGSCFGCSISHILINRNQNGSKLHCKSTHNWIMRP